MGEYMGKMDAAGQNTHKSALLGGSGETLWREAQTG